MIGKFYASHIKNMLDTETTVDELKERLAKTISFLGSVQPEQFAGTEKRLIDLRFRSLTTKLHGDAYLLQVLLPNIFFRITTAHDILRHNGVKLGKRDYLGDFESTVSV